MAELAERIKELKAKDGFEAFAAQAGASINFEPTTDEEFDNLEKAFKEFMNKSAEEEKKEEPKAEEEKEGEESKAKEESKEEPKDSEEKEAENAQEEPKTEEDKNDLLIEETAEQQTDPYANDPEWMKKRHAILEAYAGEHEHAFKNDKEKAEAGAQYITLNQAIFHSPEEGKLQINRNGDTSVNVIAAAVTVAEKEGKRVNFSTNSSEEFNAQLMIECMNRGIDMNPDNKPKWEKLSEETKAKFAAQYDAALKKQKAAETPEAEKPEQTIDTKQRIEAVKQARAILNQEVSSDVSGISPLRAEFHEAQKKADAEKIQDLQGISPLKTAVDVKPTEITSGMKDWISKGLDK